MYGSYSRRCHRANVLSRLFGQLTGPSMTGNISRGRVIVLPAFNCQHPAVSLFIYFNTSTAPPSITTHLLQKPTVRKKIAAYAFRASQSLTISIWIATTVLVLSTAVTPKERSNGITRALREFRILRFNIESLSIFGIDFVKSCPACTKCTIFSPTVPPTPFRDVDPTPLPHKDFFCRFKMDSRLSCVHL